MSQIPMPLLRNVGSQLTQLEGQVINYREESAPCKEGKLVVSRCFSKLFPQDDLFFTFNIIHAMPPKGHSYQVLHHYIPFQSACVLLTSILN